MMVTEVYGMVSGCCCFNDDEEAVIQAACFIFLFWCVHFKCSLICEIPLNKPNGSNHTTH